MATVRRQVRRIGSPVNDIDGMHWPIDAALVVLGGFLIGIALSFLKFNDPTWYRNAWTSVIGVPAFIAAGMYLSRRISQLWLRRSMQFGMVVSLLFHLVLLLALVEVNIGSEAWTALTSSNSVAQGSQNTIAQASIFELRMQDDPEFDFERPVPTESAVPLPETDEHVVVEQSAIEAQPRPVEHPEETARPSVVQHKERYESVPRRSEFLSQLSRNMSDVQIATSPAAIPEGAQVAVADDTGQPSPTTVTPSKQTMVASNTDQTSQLDDARAQMERAAAVDAPAATSQSPVTVHRDALASRIPMSIDARQQPQSATQQPLEPVLSSSRVDVARRAASGAETLASQDSFDELAQQSTTPQRRQNNVDDNPVAAQTPEPLPTRQPRLTTRPTVGLVPQVEQEVAASGNRSTNELAAAGSPLGRRTAPAGAGGELSSGPRDLEPIGSLGAAERAQAGGAAPAVEAAGPLGLDRQDVSAEPQIASAAISDSITPSQSPVASSGGLRPTGATIGRQAAIGAPGPIRQPAETTSASQTPQVARVESNRVFASTEPTLNPQGRPTDRPARAQAIADTPQSPVAVANPGNQIGTGPTLAFGGPAAMALSHGSSGIAGSGYSPNLDRQAPAGESPALTASGSSRDRATQTTDEGPALSPSARSVVARSQAGALQPSAPTPGEAGSGGSQLEGDNQLGPPATASASPVELSSRAERGPVSADRGTLQIDMGPERIVSQFQSGRGSGGGSPALNLVPQSTSNARPQRGRGGSLIALDVDTVAPQVAAPPGDGGSQPLAIDANPASTTAQRLDGGGSSNTSGGPSGAQLEGPPSEPNAADVAGPLAVRTARESMASGNGSGGGGTGGEGVGGSSGQPEARSGPGRQSFAGVAPSGTGLSASELPGATTGSGTGRGESGTGRGGGGGAAQPTASNVAIAGPNRGGGGTGDSDETGFGAGGTGATGAGGPGSGHEGPGGDGPGGGIASVGGAVAVRASEAVDAPAGIPVIGGGRATIQRQQQGTGITPEIAGLVAGEPNGNGNTIGGSSGGNAAESGPSASGVAVAQQAGGLSAGGPDSGGVESTAITAQSLGPSRAGGGRGGSAVILAQPADVSRPGRSTSGITPDLHAQVAEPAGPSGLYSESGSSGDVGPQETLAAPGPRSTGVGVSLNVDIDATPGVGGLGSTPAIDVGLNDRRARADTDQIQTSIARFPRQEVGGRPGLNPTAVMAADAFRKRLDRTGPGQGGVQLTPESEQAIELGLVFLARHQQDDGRWSLQGFDREKPAIQSDAAATALALLAFQGAGYTHAEHQYAENVRKALDFLIANQSADGLIYAAADDESNRFAQFYTHAIAALAMCEAYGMTQDPALREPAQRAIDYIVASQHEELGGWRYAPQVSSDTSVSGWMMMAMKSGELAGLNVPQKSYDGILKWLNAAQASENEPHLYRYNPYAEDNATQRHGRRASKTMTSVGLLMRLYTGWRRDNKNLQRGADYLMENLPTIGAANETILERRRDTYYWYYATQVMFHMGGDAWREWNAALHPLLVDTQVLDGALAGSWDPLLPVPDRWAGQGGRLYVTTMNLLSLEVSYRHLPLYEDTAR